MINIIIFSCVCLTAALFLMGFICFNIMKISAQCNDIAQKIMQIDTGAQLIDKKITSFEAKLGERFDDIKAMQKTSTLNTGYVGKEHIEQNYERAKTLLKRGMPLDRELMQSCSMTEEELELLSELHDA